MRDLLLIFVKHPLPGQVKTRLASGLGQEKALAIYGELLIYTRDIVNPLPVDKAVFYGNEMPAADLWSAAGFLRRQQEGPDLGARMEAAFAWGFEAGYERIVVIGSDCAWLNGAILQEAFEQLGENDSVIGPATDGGYYLLGLRMLFPPVFYDKNWSTETIFTDTMDDLEAGGKSVFVLPALSDVDVAEDLRGTFLEKYLN
ncbi:MAG: glycosyltransferase [Bacteroidetes bacterium]|nr:MAG: glycosyltransferase [Bacteroidota bacterium]